MPSSPASLSRLSIHAGLVCIPLALLVASGWYAGRYRTDFVWPAILSGSDILATIPDDHLPPLTAATAPAP